MTTIEHLESYRAVLLEHDFDFAQSMDEAHLRAGREQLMALRQAQPLVDPQCSVWNSIAPEGHQVHIVRGAT